MSNPTTSPRLDGGVPPLPALDWLEALEVVGVGSPGAGAGAAGVSVQSGEGPTGVEFGRAALERVGFSGKVGETLVIPAPSGPSAVLVGIGPSPTVDDLRDAAAAFARATAGHTAVALRLTVLGALDAAEAAAALVEGVVLARYRYRILQSAPKEPLLERLELAIDGAEVDALEAGIREALVTVRATLVTRDLANTPPGHLTAVALGDIAVLLGERFGFGVELFDRAALIALGCGGILGVNAGSAEEPRLIKLTFNAEADSPLLAMVGKGVMYDSGGISLKPSDAMHLLMKMDMAGAAAVLGAFTGFAELGVTSRVSAWLCCTDNMPSGSAYKLGDVLTARGGTTVEVKNTDAEGRLVMMDGLVLATEDDAAAIVDIATLTGAAMRALGGLTAALFTNDRSFADQIEAAAAATGEQVWELPLERRYRRDIDSKIADIANMGTANAGATHAALFLESFVAGTPWVHLDIAGTMQADRDDSWRSAGATGFGARILLESARRFTPPAV